MAKREPKKVKKELKKLGKPRKIKIRVIGIGGGGSSIVSELASRIQKVSFVVANTDVQTLKTSSNKASKFHFGQEITRGWGTGMNPDLGKEAAQKEKDRIKKLLEGYDFCILVASLGGGTGSGAAPVFAKISKDLNKVTYGIFTLPFRFEGERKMEIAKSALRQLKPKLDIFSVIPNERIFKIIDRKTPLKKALSSINQSLAESLEGLIEVIYKPALINIDFADFQTVLSGLNPSSGKRRRGRKLAYLNTVQVTRRKRGAKELVEKMLSNPLYPYSIKGAKGVLLNIAGAQDLSLAEVSQISKAISGLANKDAKIIFGISQSKRYKGILKTTLLATGIRAKIFFPTLKKKKSTPKQSRKKESTKIKSEKKKSTKKRKKRAPRKSKKKPKKKTTKKVKSRKAKKINIKVHKAKLSPPQKTSPSEKQKEGNPDSIDLSEGKIRKNGLQIKKEMEAEEEEMLAREKFWETPAFLRKKKAESK